MNHSIVALVLLCVGLTLKTCICGVYGSRCYNCITEHFGATSKYHTMQYQKCISNKNVFHHITSKDSICLVLVPQSSRSKSNSEFVFLR